MKKKRQEDNERAEDQVRGVHLFKEVGGVVRCEMEQETASGQIGNKE